MLYKCVNPLIKESYLLQTDSPYADIKFTKGPKPPPSHGETVYATVKI